MSQVGRKYARMRALQNMYAGVSSNERIAVATSSFDNHHYISDSRNEPFNMYTFVLNTPSSGISPSSVDPAKKVLPNSNYYSSETNLFYRTLFRNCKTIY